MAMKLLPLSRLTALSAVLLLTLVLAGLHHGEAAIQIATLCPPNGWCGPQPQPAPTLQVHPIRRKEAVHTGVSNQGSFNEPQAQSYRQDSGTMQTESHRIPSHVVHLDDRNLYNAVRGAGGVALVNFYSSWSEESRATWHEYEQVAQQMRGDMMVAAIDAARYRNVAHDYHIKVFPTVKLILISREGKLQAITVSEGEINYQPYPYIMN